MNIKLSNTEPKKYRLLHIEITKMFDSAIKILDSLVEQLSFLLVERTLAILHLLNIQLHLLKLSGYFTDITSALRQKKVAFLQKIR
ncbi:hypothetical protein VTH8203_00544 [Vibrio thalassae]|uniref:Uncharacterized protein n=1 Tax=Vibrio thalassae TaxID=1243014 RepID=A0A240EFF4_9VIBR|nr:hypothetical protein VTH8203_00544 [Vibrio thalassae]